MICSLCYIIGVSPRDNTVIHGDLTKRTEKLLKGYTNEFTRKNKNGCNYFLFFFFLFFSFCITFSFLFFLFLFF